MLWPEFHRIGALLRDQVRTRMLGQFCEIDCDPKSHHTFDNSFPQNPYNTPIALVLLFFGGSFYSQLRARFANERLV